MKELMRQINKVTKEVNKELTDDDLKHHGCYTCNKILNYFDDDMPTSLEVDSFIEKTRKEFLKPKLEELSKLGLDVYSCYSLTTSTAFVYALAYRVYTVSPEYTSEDIPQLMCDIRREWLNFISTKTEPKE